MQIGFMLMVGNILVFFMKLADFFKGNVDDVSIMSDDKLSMEAYWEVQNGRLNNKFSKEINRRVEAGVWSLK